MFYRVTARLKPDTAADLDKKLRYETIKRQRPDGQEIIKALNRAVLTESGRVQFSIVCYCATPLAHERATVFDKYFESIETEVIEGYEEYQGRPFMEYLVGFRRC